MGTGLEDVEGDGCVAHLDYGGVETIRLESFVRSVEALLLKSTDGITSWDPGVSK